MNENTIKSRPVYLSLRLTPQEDAKLKAICDYAYTDRSKCIRMLIGMYYDDQMSGESDTARSWRIVMNQLNLRTKAGDANSAKILAAIEETVTIKE